MVIARLTARLKSRSAIALLCLAGLALGGCKPNYHVQRSGTIGLNGAVILKKRGGGGGSSGPVVREHEKNPWGATARSSAAGRRRTGNAMDARLSGQASRTPKPQSQVRARTSNPFGESSAFGRTKRGRSNPFAD